MGITSIVLCLQHLVVVLVLGFVLLVIGLLFFIACVVEFIFFVNSFIELHLLLVITILDNAKMSSGCGFLASLV